MNPNLALIFLCLFIGIGLRLSGKFPKTSPHSFNLFVIWVSLPAVVLTQVPRLLRTMEWTPAALIPVSMAWILFALAFAFFSLLGRWLKWKRTEMGALILTAGLGNTSFVGLPLLDALYGSEGVRVGVLVDQPGTFLVLSTLGLLVASLMSPDQSKGFKFSTALKTLMTFPPFLALIAAFIWTTVGEGGESSLTQVLDRLAGTLVPLALVSVGFQLKFSDALMRRQWKPLFWGLSFKLFLAPLFFWALYMQAFGNNDFVTRITVLEAAMAPMITAGVVAEEFGLNAEIANLMVGVGIPLSLLTVHLWNSFLA